MKQLFPRTNKPQKEKLYVALTPTPITLQRLGADPDGLLYDVLIPHDGTVQSLALEVALVGTKRNVQLECRLVSDEGTSSWPFDAKAGRNFTNMEFDVKANDHYQIALAQPEADLAAIVKSWLVFSIVPTESSTIAVLREQLKAEG